MNVDTTELKTVEQTSKAEEIVEVLTLAWDDLDLIGGGVVGSLL